MTRKLPYYNITIISCTPVYCYLISRCETVNFVVRWSLSILLEQGTLTTLSTNNPAYRACFSTKQILHALCISSLLLALPPL